VVQLEEEFNRMDRIGRIKEEDHYFFFILFILSILFRFLPSFLTEPLPAFAGSLKPLLTASPGP
jgi:hypothetical protein